MGLLSSIFGGGSAPQQQSSSVAQRKEAAPYMPDLMAKGWALANQQYTPYTGDRTAAFTDLQNKSFTGAGNMAVSPYLADAGTGLKDYMARAAGTSYTPTQYTNQFTAPAAYKDSSFTADKVTAPQLQNYQMTAPADVQAQKFTGASAQDYMSPYMQNVVDIQQREAQRQADIAGTSRGAQAAKSGAFGGSRQAILDAEAARNLATQKGDIQAQGQQAAYQNAQAQFNADQARQMQAALANQGVGYNVGAQNLAANLGVQSLGAGQNMTAAQLNQAANLQAAGMGEQSKQFGYGQGMTAAGLNAQYGQAANQLNEQANQYGAGLGLQGLQAAGNMASGLANVGNMGYNQQMGIYGLQNQYGAQQQQQQQNILNQQYEDFMNQRAYPQSQLSWFSGLASGSPLSTNTTSYTPAPSLGSQLGGLATAGYGMYRMSGMAAGGMTDSGAGLADLAISKMA